MRQPIRGGPPALNYSAAAAISAGRWGLPEDLTGVAVFLASRTSDFTTGALRPVDAGFSAMG
jgi:2-deoxy-D-gluconate 3-dehydrogenase